MWYRRLAALLVLAAPLVVPATARAAGSGVDSVVSDDPTCADAAAHLRIARRAITVNDYATAIANFKTSYELDGEPLTLVFLARAYVHENDLFSAIELYKSYLDQVPSGLRASYVEGEIDRLTDRLLAQRIAIFDDDAR
ncbi:MAG TPA: hypothetical protein VN947_12710 [Polyangia bacterium]|nr:hypothetical protein [Polyangia bacterium]